MNGHFCWFNLKLRLLGLWKKHGKLRFIVKVLIYYILVCAEVPSGPTCGKQYLMSQPASAHARANQQLLAEL